MFWGVSFHTFGLVKDGLFVAGLCIYILDNDAYIQKCLY